MSNLQGNPSQGTNQQTTGNGSNARPPSTLTQAAGFRPTNTRSPQYRPLQFSPKPLTNVRPISGNSPSIGTGGIVRPGAPTPSNPPLQPFSRPATFQPSQVSGRPNIPVQTPGNPSSVPSSPIPNGLGQGYVRPSYGSSIRPVPFQPTGTHRTSFAQPGQPMVNQQTTAKLPTNLNSNPMYPSSAGQSTGQAIGNPSTAYHGQTYQPTGSSPQSAGAYNGLSPQGPSPIYANQGIPPPFSSNVTPMQPNYGQVHSVPNGAVPGQPMTQNYNQGIQQPNVMSAANQVQPGFNGMPQLQNTFQGMGLGSIPQQPAGVNLMAAPPPPEAFATPVSVPDNSMQSVSQSPTANAPISYKRCTLNSIPNNDTLEDRAKLPFGLIITPFKHLQPGEPEIPVIQSPQIVRCRRCRSYINPWVQFVEQGARWKCNMCYLANDVPSFFDWDGEKRVRVDRLNRPELSCGVVEYIAPQEYMVRPPQPVVFVFVIDVSYGAVQSGMVATAAKAIYDSLDRIPNSDDRTKVAFITFDSSIQFYNLNPSNTEAQMLIVSDISEVYLPLPCDLLVSLSESRPIIDSFLQKLPSMFGTNTQSLSALARALKFAEKLIGPIGGKIVSLQYSLPNHDEAALKMREDPNLRGTAKETQLLLPANSFYKDFAVECSSSQISIDLFLFNPEYADIATLSGCAKYTGGGLYYYQGFNANRHEDAVKFGTELLHLLTRPLGLEAVLRIRAPKGIRMMCFHGNFFLRSSDLLSLPNVSPDNSYAVELAVNEELKTPTVCFQTALLYTSSSGERRIRVLTLSLPVTNSLSEVYSSADHHAIATLLVKKAIDRSLTSKIEDARDALTHKLTDILTVYKSAFSNQQSHPQQLMISENLKLLPAYILGMLKNLCFKDSTAISTDIRSYMLAMHYPLCPEVTCVSLYPRFWSIQSFVDNPSIGQLGADGQMIFPPLLNLSSEKLDRGGIFMLENGLELFIWLGREVNHELLLALFGHATLDLAPVGKTTLMDLPNDLSKRVNAFVKSIRDTRLRQHTVFLPLFVVREDGDKGLRMWFLSHLIEDRIENALSYPQFLATIRENVKKAK